MALSNRKQAAAQKFLAESAMPIPAPPLAPPAPRSHRIWVADWAICTYDSKGETPVIIRNAYLQDPHYSIEFSEERKVSDVILFKMLRAPEDVDPLRYPVEYIVAQFDRHSVRGVTSHNWHWEGLGVW